MSARSPPQAPIGLRRPDILFAASLAKIDMPVEVVPAED